ncbi:MAG: glycyl-tRNA synthetase beta chain, partial [Pseudomonadota bacterium]|nr:glycyl-tRNA synthetase beta chain [Pseudomonadota bacterium]
IAASEVAKFEKRMDGKTETFFYEATVKGVRLEDELGTGVGDALKKLPIPKVMRWGDSDVQFVRPVHGLVMLHGEHVAAGEVLGLQSGNTTLGHRFLAEGTIVLASAEEYEGKLETVGKAIVSFARRREMIAKALQAKADELGAKVKLIDALLDEVTALVEWPVIYVSEFESEYLEVPQECLILTMQANQKYFPLFDAAGKLQNRFLIVSNMAVADPTNIITGNARVVRPRLSDARFFFNQDRKNGFVSRAMKLGSVVYHNKLGSLGDRAQRLGAVAAFIGDKLGADANLARNAGLLCKVDLLTDMVGEFPELQGIMGRYYAEHEGAKPDVAEAMDHHYRPRFAGDVLPGSNVSCAVALADKLDALVGFFGIGQVPTGDKDPFGLRRAALGVLRILMEKPLPLDLGELIAETAKAFPTGMLSAAGFEAQLHDFMLDRLRGYLRDAGHAQDAVEAVLSQRPTRIDLVPAKLEAVKKFVALDAALALAAANKRIGNILKKAEGTIPEPDLALLQEPAEKALFERVIKLAPLVKSHVANGDYADALQALATVRAEVDSFFDTVMVNVDEPLLRANRLGLLKALFDQLNAVADISKLAV